MEKEEIQDVGKKKLSVIILKSNTIMINFDGVTNIYIYIYIYICIYKIIIQISH